MKQTTKHKNETLNTKQKRKAILQGKPYKRRTWIKTVNPDRKVDRAIQSHRLEQNLFE